MDATRPTRGCSATGTWTVALVVLLLLCASAVLSACGAASTRASSSTSPSSGGVAAYAAASPSATPLPRGAGRGTVAFTRYLWKQGDFEVCVVNTDGTGLRRLAADARGPAWSPDGARIAYTSFLRGGVWVMNADGSGKRRVAPTPVEAEWVAWSPDGGHLLFSTTTFSSLSVVNTDGSGLTSVFARAPGYAGYSPAWAPDGRIFFGRRSGSLGEICSLDPGGRGLTVVTAAQSPPIFSLSPDGKWLAIWEGDRLVRMAASGRGLAVVLNEEVSPYLGVLSSWSPNGSKIVLGRDSRVWLSEWSVLHVAKADGSDVWEVPNTEGAYDPVWRPE